MVIANLDMRHRYRRMLACNFAVNQHPGLQARVANPPSQTRPQRPPAAMLL
jgi:hypothetical protein